MSDLPDPLNRRFEAWRPIFDLCVGAAMLLFAFIGIAASDVTNGGSKAYWMFLGIGFGLLCMLLDWIHERPGTAWANPLLLTAVHWIGVLAAMEMVDLFVQTGRINSANTGLILGVIVSLGTFSTGVHTNWRLAVIGAALGLGTAAIAYVQQYLWVLFALALLALAAIYLISRVRARWGTHETV